MEEESVYPLSESETEIEVLGSRFIASLYPLNGKEEVKSLHEKTKEHHPKARHYPYAYRYLPFEGASDDGEPKGSTGLPLLEGLRQKKADRILVVVTRYFGGTKLGLSRLTRTYRETLLEAVSKMTLAKIEPCLAAEIETSYPLFEDIKRRAEHLDIQIENVVYALSVKLTLIGDAKIIEALLDAYPTGVRTISSEIRTLRRAK